MSDQPVAIVTGAGRGIGRATASELSDRGFAVVICARTRADLEETAEHCAGDVLVVPTDVRDTLAIDAAVDAAVEGFGRLDAVVNNAGFAPMRSVVDTDDDVLAATLDINVAAAFRFARSAWRHLGKQGGAIVNVSSQAARDPLVPFAAYAAAKSAVNGMTLALAREGEPLGIRCHAVAPGAVETAMLREIIDETVVPYDATLEPEAVAMVIADCIDGPLIHTNGECIYMKK
ncbi:MAG: SDR family oxidoreductase [Planctomycetota bacterium]